MGLVTLDGSRRSFAVFQSTMPSRSVIPLRGMTTAATKAASAEMAAMRTSWGPSEGARPSVHRARRVDDAVTAPTWKIAAAQYTVAAAARPSGGATMEPTSTRTAEGTIASIGERRVNARRSVSTLISHMPRMAESAKPGRPSTGALVAESWLQSNLIASTRARTGMAAGDVDATRSGKQNRDA